MTSVRRALKPLFRVGLFDDIPAWPALGQNDIASAAHVQIRDEAASQSFVLLKHTNKLPLRSGVRIAVIGPQANSTGLFSDYFVCWSAHPHYQSNTTCATTIAAAVGALNIGGVTTTRPGVGVSSKNTSMISEALEAGSLADIIILALGIDKSIEREGTDRTNITLPGLQEVRSSKLLIRASAHQCLLGHYSVKTIDGASCRTRYIQRRLLPTQSLQTTPWRLTRVGLISTLKANLFGLSDLGCR
eukprot:m.162972 g.162972  ORF g.162972 m.162972 type:complete len:245 (+) comp14615_c0_seq8:4057-4791(+)